MTRRESREQAFVLIFEQIFHPEATVAEMVEMAGLSPDVQFPDAFAVALAEKTAQQRGEIDAMIVKYAKGWRLSRLSKDSLALLRLAVCEILYMDDVPNGVSVNEAVELAKKYATTEDASFINGILGSVIRGLDK